MTEFEITFSIFIILFFGGFCAGFVDSIAGGGGLISLPVLLSVGLPPQVALGTNKLQGSFGTFSASCNYIRKGKADLKSAVTGIVFTFIGAVLGAWAIQRLDPAFIKHLIPKYTAILLLCWCLRWGTMWCILPVFAWPADKSSAPESDPVWLLKMAHGLFGRSFYPLFF